MGESSNFVSEITFLGTVSTSTPFKMHLKVLILHMQVNMTNMTHLD